MQKEPCANTTLHAIAAFKGGGLLSRGTNQLVDRILRWGAVYLSLLDSSAVISKPKVSISIIDSNTVTRHHLPSGRLADRPYSLSIAM